MASDSPIADIHGTPEKVAPSSQPDVAPSQPDDATTEAKGEPPVVEDDVEASTKTMETSGADTEPASTAEVVTAEGVTTEEAAVGQVPLAVTEPENPPVVGEVLQPPIPPPLDQVPAIEATPLAIEPKQEQMEEDEGPAKTEEQNESNVATKEPVQDQEPATTAPTTTTTTEKPEPCEEEEKPRDEASTNISTPSSASRRVFQCSSCNTYYEDWNLFLHMRNVHNRFICLLCLGLFPNAKRLARHLLNRHGQSNNHFETTTDMMEWNKQRPCHIMCVKCESVECVEGQQPHQHSCGQSSSTNADDSVATTCSKCGAVGSHLCTKESSSSGETASIGNQVARKPSKKKRPHRSESSRMSSDLVVASSSSGFKLKIKGLSSGNATAVNDNAESVVAGDDNNNMNGKDDQPVAVEGDVESTAPVNGEAGDRESGAFSFNFILSKKGLVRNPNPSRRQKQDSSNDEAPTLHRHSEDEGKQEQEPPPQTGIRDAKEEKEEGGVPPLLVSKLKLKIPKYIVPVESDDSEDYDEDDDEDDDEDEDSDAEDQKLSTENEAQFRPVKNEEATQGSSADAEIKEAAVKVEPEGTAVDRNISEKEKESRREEEGDQPIDGGDVKREGDNSTDCLSQAPTDNKQDTLHSAAVGIDGLSADNKDVVQRPSGYVEDEGDEKKGQSTAEGALGEEAVKREEGEGSKCPEPLVDADGLELADASSQSFELSLDQPLDHIPPKDFLRTCLRATIPFCLYCYHARRIAVNAKMLAVHMIGAHRFTALVDSITAEELMNATIVARLKASLDDLEHIYFNLDDYDSEVVAPLKMKAKIFECFQCRFTTGTHKELYLHNRKLHLKTVLLCLMCRSTFYNYSELLCHICPGVASRDLNYDLLFRCYYCNVNDLPSAFRLMVHLRKSHAVCEVCLEECFDQTRLSNHAWKHKLHHFCYRCGIAYRNKQDITRHLFWKHGTESELCKKCLQKRWPHIYHFCLPPLQFNCDQCVLTFGKAVHLRVHKRLHTEESPHTCAEEGCEEKFISRRMLEKHGRVHSGLPLEGSADCPAEVEGNANGLNVEKEEIIGGGASSKGGGSDDEAEGKTADPIMAMPVPNLSESDSSDSEEENSRSARSKTTDPPSRDADLLQSVKMASLSDSSEDEDSEEKQQHQQRESGDTKKSEDNNNSMDTTNDDKETLDSNHVDDATNTGAKSEEGSLLEAPPPSAAMQPSLSVQQVAVEKGDSDDEDGERSKTKAIIDIWENFRSYQATQIQQQRHSDEEEEDLIAPLPPPILHVLQSDHDYALMYKLYSRIDDDQDLKEIQDIEMMRRSGKAFRRHHGARRGSECGSSACSCGANCSCSSDNVSSTTSGSSSSSSSSSSSEDESKMTKKQRMIKAQRKAKRRAKKLKKTLAENGVAADGAENDNLLLSINDEVVTRLPETDLETTESDTDEEFYDANPYKIAQERLAEKNKLDEEAEEEKRLRREKRRRHRLARRQAKLKDLEEKTGAALESRLEAAAAAACPESHALMNKLLAAASTPTTPQNVVPPLRLSFSARLKDTTPGGKMNGGVGKQRSRTNSPIVVDSVRFNQTPPPPPSQHYSQANHAIGGAFARFDGQRGFGDRAVSRTASVDGGTAGAAPGTPSVNDEDSSSSSSNVKRSKRRRIPNRFYGYEGSDEESSMAAQAGLVPGGGGAAGAGGMFRPTPPPNLTWNKEDLPSSTGTNLMMNAHSRMSVDSKLESLELMYMGEERGGGGGRGGSGGAGMPPALKKRRRQSQHAPESRTNGGGMFVGGGGGRGVGARGPGAQEEEAEEDDDFGEEDCDGGFSNDLTMMRKKRKVSRREKILLNDELITSGRTPKNSWTGGPQQQQQQHSFSGVFEKAKGVPAHRGHHPELAAQLQSAVRVVRPEPLPRLKIRTNGMKQSQAAAASTSSSVLGAGSAAANKHYAAGGGGSAHGQQQQQQQQDASADLYCYCRRPYVGEMIGCDGEGCHIEWFHFECVGILMAPQGKWFCPDCVQQRGGGGMTNGQSSAFSMTRATMHHD